MASPIPLPPNSLPSLHHRAAYIHPISVPTEGRYSPIGHADLPTTQGSAGEASESLATGLGIAGSADPSAGTAMQLGRVDAGDSQARAVLASERVSVRDAGDGTKEGEFDHDVTYRERTRYKRG